MNHIEKRAKEFKDISHFLDTRIEYSFQDKSRRNEEQEDNLHESVIKAAVYRLYLFLLIKEGIECKKEIQKFICEKEETEPTDKEFTDFLTKLDKSDVSRLQSMIEQIRYEYGFRENNIAVLFRSELIQVNKTVGFANFAKYQDRKEYFNY